MNRRYQLLPLLLLLIPMLLNAQTTPVQSDNPSISEFLNPDGTLRLDGGFSGSVDPRGWRMVTGPDGHPRFVADGTISSMADTNVQLAPGDENWQGGFGPPGTNGTIYAIAIDGDEVYVGGRFTTAGSVLASNIACWNMRDERWSVLGNIKSNGVGGVVYTIAIDKDYVYAGGTFINAASTTANGIARYNRQLGFWQPMREGVRRNTTWQIFRGGDVYATAWKGDTLVVGGYFNGSEGAGNQLVYWDRVLQRWFPFPTRPTGHIRAIAVRGQTIYVGGRFDTIGTPANPQLLRNIAKFDVATGTWSQLGSGITGITDTVFTLAIDASNNLYAGGRFAAAGGTPVTNLARWDGTSWSPIGVPANDVINALYFDGDTLHVGGFFTSIGGIGANGIASYDGAAWRVPGQGVGVSVNAVTRFEPPKQMDWIYREFEILSDRRAHVSAIAVGNGSLFAGGHFSSAGRYTTHNIARWDGRRWWPVEKTTYEELNVNGTDGTVYAAAIDGDDLYIGGDFTHAGGLRVNRVARWNGSRGEWSSLDSGIDGAASVVRSIGVWRNDVYVGGIFNSASGVSSTGIVAWDGSAWQSMAGGVGGSTPFVFCITPSASGIYLGGAFTSAGPTPTKRVALWNGSSFAAIGPGANAGVANEGTKYAYVSAIAVDGNEVYVGGDFTRAGEIEARNLARFAGDWESIGDVDGIVTALAIDSISNPNIDTTKWNLYVGGEFNRVDGMAATRLARWNKENWFRMGAGINGAVRSLSVSPSGSLYVGGAFTRADTVSASNLALWDGLRWRKLGRDTANGANAPVHMVVAASDRRVYIGGEFNVASGISTNFIAEWDSRGWSSLGSDPEGGLYGQVLALAVRNGELYAGGNFEAAGGMRTNGIARWDGRKWTRLGSGVDGPVRSLLFAPNGDLYAAGEFANAGEVPAAAVARWDGNAWHGLGTGLASRPYTGPNAPGTKVPYVASLAMSGDWLYVGGGFDTAGGVPASRVARWNTRSGGWSALGEGIAGAASGPYTFVTSLATKGDTLYAGGFFTRAGSSSAINIAQWDGAAWTPLGNGGNVNASNGFVYALDIGLRGELYVGGSFFNPAYASDKYMKKWENGAWDTIPGVVWGPVYTFGRDKGDLYVGGAFSVAADFQANRIVRFDGTNWHMMGSGVYSDYRNKGVMAVAALGERIYVGGDFTIAGGKPSYFLATWLKPTPLFVENERAVSGPASSTSSTAEPNPFSESIAIGFKLDGGASVKLSIHSLDGREVARLVDERLPAGEHRVQWNAAEEAAGVYLYRLVVDGKVLAGKVVRR